MNFILVSTNQCLSLIRGTDFGLMHAFSFCQSIRGLDFVFVYAMLLLSTHTRYKICAHVRIILPSIYPKNSPRSTSKALSGHLIKRSVSYGSTRSPQQFIKRHHISSSIHPVSSVRSLHLRHTTVQVICTPPKDEKRNHMMYTAKKQ